MNKTIKYNIPPENTNNDVLNIEGDKYFPVIDSIINITIEDKIYFIEEDKMYFILSSSLTK